MAVHAFTNTTKSIKVSFKLFLKKDYKGGANSLVDKNNTNRKLT